MSFYIVQDVTVRLHKFSYVIKLPHYFLNILYCLYVFKTKDSRVVLCVNYYRGQTAVASAEKFIP